MSTVEQLGERWPKVLAGFADAKVSPDDIKAVTAAVNNLTLQEAMAAVPMKFASDSGDEQKARRNLYRAAHCLWYLAYRSDKSLPVVSWQTFHDTRSALESLRGIVLDHVKKALGRNELPISAPQDDRPQVTARAPVVVRSSFNALKTFQNAANTVRGQVHAQRQQAMTPVERARKALQPELMVATLRAQGQARQVTAQALLARSKQDVARQYFLKLFDIHSYFTDQKLAMAFNFTAMSAAVETAYKAFEQDVKKGGEESISTFSKVGLAKLFFKGLSAAPPPLSLVGKIGGAVVDTLHVDTVIDQRPQHEVLRGDAANPIASALSSTLSALGREFDDRTRVGNRLKGLTRSGDLQKALHITATHHYTLMRETVKEVCEQTFGGSSELRESKFQAFLDRLRRDKLGSVRGPLDEERLKSLAMTEADKLYKETVDIIEIMMNSSKVQMLDNDDLVGAIELVLYGNYVLHVFRKEDKTSSKGYRYDFSASLPKTIVNRLAASTTEWAVLALDSTKKSADARTRLKWEDRDNHKRALCYFFEWLQAEMNPFLMLAGVNMGGKPVTAEFIRVQMMQYITKLNKAIVANAKKEAFYSIRTTWNWDEIDIAMGRATRLDPDVLNAQLAALRGHGLSNFHALE